MANKILVVEDEEAIRGFIKVNLKRNNFDVIEAASGEEALEKLDSDAFLIENIEIKGYDVNVTVRCYSDAVPTQYVRALIEQDYFEGIEYSGYDGEEIEEDADTAFGAEKAGDYRYSFALAMRLRGGNGCELN